MRKQDKIIIWPVYFDQTETRKNGRRVPKSLAVQHPKIVEVKTAVERLGLKHELATLSVLIAFFRVWAIGSCPMISSNVCDRYFLARTV